MSKNAANKPLDTRREKLQKIHKSTTDLHNLGALKYEETKPTFLPFFRPKHAIPQTLAPSAPPPTKKPKFLVFQTRKFCPVGSNMWTADLTCARPMSRGCLMSSFPPFRRVLPTRSGGVTRRSNNQLRAGHNRLRRSRPARTSKNGTYGTASPHLTGNGHMWTGRPASNYRLFRKVLPPRSGGETLRYRNDLPTGVIRLRRISTRRNDEKVTYGTTSGHVPRTTPARR